MRNVLLLSVALTSALILLAAVREPRPQSAQSEAHDARENGMWEQPDATAQAGGARSLRPDVERTYTAEAQVFRTRPDDVAVDANARRRLDAHPRTLAGYRALRAYPGAPPRVPHGLTADELRRSLCNTCHQRGGYSPRFGAYVPLTPHAELQDCLQCHATDAGVVELPARDARPDARCRQCHRPGTAAPTAAGLDWRPAPWPQLAASDATGAPPAIPHDLQLRGNCLACHMGPGAVAEIRTLHAERANCLQCHLAQMQHAIAPGTGSDEGALP